MWSDRHLGEGGGQREGSRKPKEKATRVQEEMESVRSRGMGVGIRFFTYFGCKDTRFAEKSDTGHENQRGALADPWVFSLAVGRMVLSLTVRGNTRQGAVMGQNQSWFSNVLHFQCLLDIQGLVYVS